jgi:hypothetical protein
MATTQKTLGEWQDEHCGRYPTEAEQAEIKDMGPVAENTKQTGIEVKLIGQDGNAFCIIGMVRKAMRRGGVKAEVIEAYCKEAMSGDYDHLLQVTMEYVEVE